MLEIKEAAQQHLRKLLADEAPGTQLRAWVRQAKTPNFECGMSFSAADDGRPADVVLKFTGFEVRVAPNLMVHLQEAVVDYLPNRLGGLLKFDAPFAGPDALGPEASLADRIQWALDTHVNGELMHHGGRVALVEMQDGPTAVLQFGGGCHGCAMVDVTLKEGVEKRLRELIPELAAVRDATDHTAGENPFYT